MRLGRFTAKMCTRFVQEWANNFPPLAASPSQTSLRSRADLQRSTRVLKILTGKKFYRHGRMDLYQLYRWACARRGTAVDSRSRNNFWSPKERQQAVRSRVVLLCVFRRGLRGLHQGPRYVKSIIDLYHRSTNTLRSRKLVSCCSKEGQ